MSHKNSNEKASYTLTKSVIQKLIQKEAAEWPPYTAFGLYQPRRPDSDPKQNETK